MEESTKDYTEEYMYSGGRDKATIRIRGKVNKEKIKEATAIFMKKAEKCRKNKIKENSQNGNCSTSRAIAKE